jgi:hypothetical protein
VPVKLRLWFQQDSAPAQHEKDSGHWLNATHPGRLIGSFRADCNAHSVAGSNSILFYVATPEGSRLRSPSEDNGRRRDNRTGSCDNGQCQSICALRRVRENVVQSIAACLEVTEDRFEAYCNHEAPMV